MDRSRAARAVLAAGAAAYALAVAAASQTPGPRAWGLHLPGFLPPPMRFFILALLFGGAALLALDFLRGSTPPAARSAQRSTQAKRLPFPRGSGWLLLLPWALLLWTLVVRTRFLGDGMVWLASIQSGRPNPFSEPLAAATWSGYARLVRAIGIPFDAVTAGLLPILCGVLAAALFWGIASEIVGPASSSAPRGGSGFVAGSGSRAVVFAVLATMGFVQLYFGYIESYPLAGIAVLTYLWLGLRRARGADHPLWLAAALAISIAFHLITVVLVPSYLYLVLREKRALLQRAALAILPLAGAIGIFFLLGYPPERWIGAFRIAARAVQPGHGDAVLAKPYSVFSLDHGWDLLNAILLVLPIPALLLLAALAGRAPAPAHDRAARFLAAAGITGLLVAIALVLPVPPAQDWDLTSILLLPLAVFGVKLGCSIPDVPLRGRRGVALAMIGAGALFSFVLVNAGGETGLRRFETLVGPGAKITPYGRAYGNELLATHDVERRDFQAALVHSQRALDAEPTNPRYWVKKGAALYELGRYKEAIPVLEEGIRRGPARDDAYYDLGNCLARENRYPEALVNYREAIRLSEPRPDYLNNLAVALFNTGKADSARAVWTDVVRRWPSYELSRRALERRFGPGAADSASGPGSTKPR